MTGWTLSKDETVWTIPAEHSKVPAKGYAVYTGKSDGTVDPTFGLSGTKGFIVVLTDKEGNIIDKVDNSSAREGGIVQIPDGKSWGRKTDAADEFVLFDTPTIGAPNGAAQGGAVSIKIDGNFDDWADVASAEPSDAFIAFKVANDADNFYFYVESDPGSRLWSGGAYLYLYFNFKNDLTQGEYGGATGMHDNKYDAYTFMYLFGGSADAPVIENNPNGGEGHGLTLDNIVIAGTQPATSSDIVKMEIVIPRANFTTQVNAGDVIEVDAYRSKDGGNVYFPGYVVK